MSGDDWQRIKAVAQFLMEAEPKERPALLEQLCGNDQEFRCAVASLLEADDDAGDFLEDPPAGGLSIGAGREPLTHIGEYRIVREIGSGGMGVLYEAIHEGEFQKKAAIKVIKRGMDSRSIVRRFQRERQILAGLSHPNITMLLDGGSTSDGRPYFMMEYVEGKPITDYCNALKLPTDERLELFRTVCMAVHYAHQNLVVHRDLKPTNILVASDGVPKLLDFGIAKILNLGVTAGTIDLTAPMMQVMTPEYASPEQVRGDPITTASDIYSLGVVLYELLTGQRPYRFTTRAPQQIAQVICEQEPERPSNAVAQRAEATQTMTNGLVGFAQEGHPEQLRKRLKGDVDNIILKALQKDPRRRYASAEQFAEDIKRYLAGLTVMARKDTAAYRAEKFLRRHKGGVLAGALIAIALIGGLVVSVWQGQIARAERQKAERRFQEVRELANAVVFDLHDAIQKLPGSTAARELLVTKAVKYLDSLAGESKGDISLQRELAAAYERISRVQGNPGSANLGNTASAARNQEKAIAIREQVLAHNPASPDARRELARSYRSFGILVTGMDSKRALDYFRRSLVIHEQLTAANPNDIHERSEVASAYVGVAYALMPLGDEVSAVSYLQKAIAILRQATAESHDQSLQYRLTDAYRNLGGVLNELKRHAESLESFHAALAIDEAMLATDPTSTRLRLNISWELGDIGNNMFFQGDFRSAVSYCQKSLSIQEQLATEDPKDARVRYYCALGHANVANALARLGQRTEAFAHLRKSAAIAETLVQVDPLNRGNRIFLSKRYGDLGGWYASFAKSLHQRELWREAQPWLHKAMDSYQALALEKPLPISSVENFEEVRKLLAECTEALATR